MEFHKCCCIRVHINYLCAEKLGAALECASTLIYVSGVLHCGKKDEPAYFFPNAEKRPTYFTSKEVLNTSGSSLDTIDYQ